MSFEFLLDPFTEFHCRGTVRHSLKSIQQRLESLIDPCAGACGVKFLKHSVQMAARCVCVVFEWKAHDFRTIGKREPLEGTAADMLSEHAHSTSLGISS